MPQTHIAGIISETRQADLVRTPLNIAAAQTDAAAIGATAGKRIRILAVLALSGGTATNLTFNTKGAGAGVAISPVLANGANGGELAPYNEAGWFETNSGEALTVTTGSGSTTGIMILSVLV